MMGFSEEKYGLDRKRGEIAGYGGGLDLHRVRVVMEWVAEGMGFDRKRGKERGRERGSRKREKEGEIENKRKI